MPDVAADGSAVTLLINSPNACVAPVVMVAWFKRVVFVMLCVHVDCEDPVIPGM